MNIEEGAIISVDKPYGWTSADVVRKIKFLLQKKTGQKKIKVGHAGTLDPLATGVLLICVGKATKLADSLQAEEKEYIADIRLGATTPGFDLEKEIDATYPFDHITKEAVEQTLQQFIGVQEQIPPIFSAKLIDGKRAYELARAGQEIAMKPAVITIKELLLLSCDIPDITIKITCSKGTYIRSLARDIGLSLQSGGHLTALQRTRSGKHRVEEAFNMETVENIIKNLDFHRK
ncbi:MAG: tRNA pseudouridine(55) synthase TruB [Bacteroidales bacterium]|nr:tRNA pseudouridine(55) synthase TruB [Bacteroidales bacterium]MCL2133202.1 tRNA pseudouridine(55) synthase TruB [Bacteroidales bacterium]